MSKLSYFNLLVVVLISLSCKQDSVNAPIDTRHSFEIDLTDYSNNHYFLDTIYASVLPQYNSYNKYHQVNSMVNTYYIVKNLTVWKSSRGLLDTIKQKRSNIFLNLPELANGEKYDSTFYNTDQFSIWGERMINERFEILEQGTDYIYNQYTGEVTFLFNVQNYDGFASTYSIEGETPAENDDIVFGDYSSEKLAILKLFKPEFLQPQNKQAWKLQLRNMYYIGAENIFSDNFDLEIEISVSGNLQNYIVDAGNPKKLLDEFEFDRYDIRGNHVSDGKFDFFDGITINSSSGEIIFPFLEPFGRDLPESIPDSFKVFPLYDTNKTFVDKSDISFKITGKYNN